MELDEYRGVAPVYDFFTAPFLDQVRRRVCRLCRREGLQRVADLCCGTGRQVIMLDREGIPAVGVDISPAMLAVARRHGPVGRWFLEDASRTRFPNNGFDGVIVSFALHEKPADLAEGILDEAFRLTAPGGTIFLADYRSPASAGHRLALSLAAVAERAAGKAHFGYYREFLKSGAMEARLQSRAWTYKAAGNYLWGAAGLFTVIKPFVGRE